MLSPHVSAVLRRIGLSALLVLLATAFVRSDDQQAQSAPADSEQAAVDFMALSADGRPISDLKREELTLKVGGRAREIRSLQFVQVAPLRPSGPPPTGPAMAPPFGSNRLADSGRTVVLVVDRESIRPTRERAAREAVARLLMTLSAGDQVALVTLPIGGLEVDLTRDHDRIREALPRIRAQAPSTTGSPGIGGVDPRGNRLDPQQESVATVGCHTRQALSSLSGLLQGLAGVEGPKTLVYLSSGLLPPRAETAKFGTSTPCDVRSEYFEQVATAANLARAHFYVIQPDELLIDPGSTAFQDQTSNRFGAANEELAGLQSLAGVTGGQLLKLLGTGDNIFHRVAIETSAYYLLTFVADASDRLGTSHRVELRAARENVTVRTRSHLTLAKADPKAASKSVTPQNMLRDSRMYRDLPLRLIAYPSRNPGDSKLKIVAVAEAADSSAALTAAAFGLVDVGGRLVSQSTVDPKELSTSPFMTALVAKTGAYRLRVAAIDSAGRRGTSDYEFKAELTSAGPLTISGMALGVIRNGSFAPKLQFGDEPAALVYVEVYGTPKAVALSITLEVAASSDGPALATVAGKLSPSQDEDRRTLSGAIPIASLTSGDYLVRGIVHVDGQPVARITRTLRKSIR